MLYRNFLLLYFVVLLGLPAAAEKQLLVEVRLSPPLGMVCLLESLAGSPGYLSEPLDVLREQSAFRELDKSRVDALVEAIRSYADQDGELSTTLRKEALSCDTLRAFLHALKGRVSPEIHEDISLVLGALEADYLKFIWKPSLVRLETQKRELDIAYSGPEALKLFEQAMAFYPSPGAAEFVVGLVPMPPQERPVSGALAFQEGLIFFVPDNDMGGRAAGVVFHEIVHVMQMRTDQSHLVQMFSHAGLTQAGTEINEAVATVLGNYLLRLRLEGRPPEGVLYSDPYVEEYARALIPMLSEYLLEHRSFDEAFVTSAVSAYKSAYPKRLQDPAFVFRHSILTGPSELLVPNGLIPHLARSGHLRSMRRVFPFSPEALSDNTLTALCLLSSNQLDSMTGVLEPAGREYLEQGGSVWSQLVGDRWWFFQLSSADDADLRRDELWKLVTRKALLPGGL